MENNPVQKRGRPILYDGDAFSLIVIEKKIKIINQ